MIVGGGSYENVLYENRGTLQPKFDLRIDQEISGEGRILYAAGVAFTEGIIQTQIGPFDAQPGTISPMVRSATIAAASGSRSSPTTSRARRRA